jgi:ParB-like chromosome segregation protein Spo0J
MIEYEFHPIADIFPLIPEQDISGLVSDLQKNGQINPIVLYDGKILDGRNRYLACKEAGIEPRFTEYTGDDAVGYSVSLNLHRRHLSEAQRANVAARIANMTKADSGRLGGQSTEATLNLGLLDEPKISNQEAAEKLGVGVSSVEKAKKVQKEAEPEVVAAIDAGKLSINAASKVSKMDPETQREIIEQINDGVKPTEAIKKAHVAHNSGKNEWYTPEKFITAARKVMGSIDFDPASNEIANKTVGATVYKTKDDSGLDVDWSGNVWMNPPYAQPLIRQFAEKIVEQLPNIHQGIVLVNNATETKWFQHMAERASALCLISSRVKFLDPDGNPGAPLQGQVALYFGDNPAEFCKEFSEFGVSFNV